MRKKIKKEVKTELKERFKKKVLKEVEKAESKLKLEQYDSDKSYKKQKWELKAKIQEME